MNNRNYKFSKRNEGQGQVKTERNALQSQEKFKQIVFRTKFKYNKQSIYIEAFCLTLILRYVEIEQNPI